MWLDGAPGKICMDELRHVLEDDSRGTLGPAAGSHWVLGIAGGYVCKYIYICIMYSSHLSPSPWFVVILAIDPAPVFETHHSWRYSTKTNGGQAWLVAARCGRVDSGQTVRCLPAHWTPLRQYFGAPYGRSCVLRWLYYVMFHFSFQRWWQYIYIYIIMCLIST